MDRIVRIVNTSDEDFTAEYELQWHRVPANSSALFPIGVVNCWLGDPEARDTERDKMRRMEWNRMKIRYGAYDDPEAWERMKPSLEVYTPEGERVWTVCDDPDGNRGQSLEIVGGHPGSVADRIDTLTRELDALRATVKMDDRGSLAATPDSLDVESPAASTSGKAPSDTPSAGGRSRKRVPVEPPGPDVVVPKDAPSRVGIS